MIENDYMSVVFINALNAKSGGGRSILTNFLSILSTKHHKHEYLVLVPNAKEYAIQSNSTVEIIEIPNIVRKTYLYPLVNKWILPSIIRTRNCEIVFNLSDIPIPTDIIQIFLFDWSYAAFPESPVWQMMDIRSLLVRKLKLYLFKKYYKYVDVMIAQTPVMKSRLENLYDIKDIEIVPNAVSLENYELSSGKIFDLGDGYILLYLTYYYPHKNIEIFLPLAQEIKLRGENIKIVITIDPHQHPLAAKLLKEIRRLELHDVIVNIGSVPMNDVPSLYKQIDGLLMPTLLESFSGTYVEAMFHQKPIFTSDLEFAHGVCQDAAYYFDPFDHLQILAKIVECRDDPIGRQKKIDAGEKVLDELLTWQQAFAVYENLISAAIPR